MAAWIPKMAATTPECMLFNGNATSDAMLYGCLSLGLDECVSVWFVNWLC